MHFESILVLRIYVKLSGDLATHIAETSGEKKSSEKGDDQLGEEKSV